MSITNFTGNSKAGTTPFANNKIKGPQGHHINLNKDHGALALEALKNGDYQKALTLASKTPVIATQDSKKRSLSPSETAWVEGFLKACDTAKQTFKEYVKKFNLQSQVNQLVAYGCHIGLTSDVINPESETVNIGLTDRRNIGTAYTPDIDKPQLYISLAYKHLYPIGHRLFMNGQDNTNALRPDNLSGIFFQNYHRNWESGDDNECEKTNLPNQNFMCIDKNNQEEVLSDLEQALSNPNTKGVVIPYTIHGGVPYIEDDQEMLKNTYLASETLHSTGFTCNKPILVIFHTCYAGHQLPDSKGAAIVPGENDRDTTCLTLSKLTTEPLICAYHHVLENDHTVAYSDRVDPLNMILDKQYDYYRNGELIKRNVSADELNELTGNVYNNGTFAQEPTEETYKNYLNNWIAEKRKEYMKTHDKEPEIIDYFADEESEKISTIITDVMPDTTNIGQNIKTTDITDSFLIDNPEDDSADIEYIPSNQEYSEENDSSEIEHVVSNQEDSNIIESDDIAETKDNNGKNTNGAAIAGGIIGGIAAVGATIGASVYCARKKNSSEQLKNNNQNIIINNQNNQEKRSQNSDIVHVTVRNAQNSETYRMQKKKKKKTRTLTLKEQVKRNNEDKKKHRNVHNEIDANTGKINKLTQGQNNEI